MIIFKVYREVNTIKKLKNKKVGDHTGLRNEMLKAGGHDLIKSLQIIFNKIMNQRVIPTSWKIITTKSIYKK